MNILDKASEIARLDSSGMSHNIIHMPQDILWGYEKSTVEFSADFARDLGSKKRVIIVAARQDIFAAEIIYAQYSASLKLDLSLPEDLKAIDENALYIFLDYAGQNEKLAKLLEQVVEKNCPIGLVGSAAVLPSGCHNSLCVKLAQGKLSRMALPYTFTALIRIMEEFQIVPSQAKLINQIVASLITRAGALAAHVKSDLNFGKISAQKIAGKIPLIISDDHQLRFLAKYWKQQFNLNSKIPAFYGDILPFSQDQQHRLLIKNFDNIIPIFIKRFANISANNQHLEDFIQYLSLQKKEYLEFYTEGKNMVSEYFSLIYLGAMISCYLAFLQQKDPAENLRKENK